jgi:hypothetical protein
MKNFIVFAILVSAAFLSGCDPQSGIASKSVEKYTTTPSPARTPEPVEQIDPADSIAIEATQEGPRISIPPADEKKGIDCKDYNEVRINGDGKTVNIKGVCRQLMINGDRNRVTGVAFTSIVLNGTENQIEYSKYADSRKPTVTDNGPANTVTKVEAAETAPVKKR